jgi:tetratricopeptide (TPR) repeat protein
VDYTHPIPSDPVIIDSTQPAQPGQAAPAAPEPDQTGLEAYEESRNLFYFKDYAGALAKSNLALSKLPTDSSLHQFRALCQFAQQDYRNAAAAINSVLSVGPGWDWTTMSGLYASTDTYTKQLRELEAFVNQNPQAAFGHFLLAYHYVTSGYNEEAIEELKRTLELEPSDLVASNLLGMLEPPEAPAEPQPETDIAEAPKFAASQLFGSWKSSSSETNFIDLQLEEDGKFEWVVNQNNQPQTTLSGEYSLADDKLMLQPQQGGPLVGIVTLAEGGGFNFKIAGSPPGDKGLDFRMQ